MIKKIRYSEIFQSFAGESINTGRNTLWLRLYGCNLQCLGFSQKDPTDPSTYILPYKDFDVSTISSIEELPVWEYACDSSYSHDARYKHLNYQDTPEDLAKKLMSIITNDKNPNGTFVHGTTGQDIDLCFTGGEPLTPKGQSDVISLLEEFKKYPGGPILGTKYNLASNTPRNIVFETNGTQSFTQKSLDYFTNPGLFNSNVLFNVSPKLFTVSGESNEKAIRPDVVKTYRNVSNNGVLKFVVGSEQRQWDELNRVVDEFRKHKIFWDVWVMPVGSREEHQKEIAAELTMKALREGYHVSHRVHTFVFGNALGT